MLKKILQLLNDNHWYIIAAALISATLIWGYGCESQVRSLIDPTKKVNRSELQVEIEYVAGIARTRVEDLDKQDAIKQALFDALTIASTGGQINTMGILNLLATIGAISWGLDRNKKLKDARATTTTTNTS